MREKVENGDLGFKTGRGFQEWTLAEAEASRRRLVAYLVHVLADKERADVLSPRPWPGASVRGAGS